MPVSTKVFSYLLEALYAVTLDESQWPTFLSRLCKATQSNLGILLRNDGTLGRRLLALGGLAASTAAVPIQEGYTRVDPVRDAFMRNPRTGIIEVEDILPHEQLERHEYYPTMVATGAVYGTCIVPCLTMRRYDLIALWRGEERPRLEQDHLDLLAMLFPHLQTALRIHQALGISEERAQNAEAILDASQTASLLLSASGHLLYMNEAAQKLASAQDGFFEKNGRIVPANFQQKAEFHGLITEAASSWQSPGGAMLLERGTGKRPLQLLVSPFHVEGARQSSRVLVLATDPDQISRFPDTLLRQLYGLTLAETDIANGLLTGFTPEAMADIRRVSVGTVRSQIKSLLSKTGTRRQTDLVRLLSTLPKAPQSWVN